MLTGEVVGEEALEAQGEGTCEVDLGFQGGEQPGSGLKFLQMSHGCLFSWNHGIIRFGKDLQDQQVSPSILVGIVTNHKSLQTRPSKTF